MLYAGPVGPAAPLAFNGHADGGTHEGHWCQEGVGDLPGGLRGVAGLGLTVVRDLPRSCQVCRVVPFDPWASCGGAPERVFVGYLWALSEARTAAMPSVWGDQPLADSRARNQEVPGPGRSVNAGT